MVRFSRNMFALLKSLGYDIFSLGEEFAKSFSWVDVVIFLGWFEAKKPDQRKHA